MAEIHPQLIADVKEICCLIDLESEAAREAVAMAKDQSIAKEELMIAGVAGTMIVGCCSGEEATTLIERSSTGDAACGLVVEMAGIGASKAGVEQGEQLSSATVRRC